MQYSKIQSIKVKLFRIYFVESLGYTLYDNNESKSTIDEDVCRDVEHGVVETVQAVHTSFHDLQKRL